MDRFKRPDFEPPPADLVDPGFLPAARLAELRAHLPKRLASAAPGTPLAAQADRFLRGVSEAAFLAHTRRRTTAPRDTRNELRSLAAKADDLMRCLHGMSADTVGTFHAHLDALALASRARRSRPDAVSELGASLLRVEGRFLGAVWELLADVEAAALYAAGHVATPSRQVKVSDAAMRGLVWHVALVHRQQFRRWPGHSRGAWFPDFMRELARGEPFRTRCGVETVAAVLSDLRGNDPDPPA